MGPVSKRFSSNSSLDENPSKRNKSTSPQDGVMSNFGLVNLYIEDPANSTRSFPLNVEMLKRIETARRQVFNDPERKFQVISDWFRRIVVLWVIDELGTSNVAVNILFNKVRENDTILSSGTSKVVKYSLNLMTRQPIASLSMIYSDPALVELKVLRMLLLQEGFVHYFGFYYYQNKKDLKKVKIRIFEKLYEGSLDKLIPTLLSLKNKVSIAFQLAEIFSRFYERHQIIHRDLKPAQIMYMKEASGDYVIKLGDFGNSYTKGDRIARTRHSTTCWFISPRYAKEYFPKLVAYRKRRKISGLPLYPKLTKKIQDIVTPAVDIWAMGCIFYEMFTGKNSPWSSKDEFTVYKELGILYDLREKFNSSEQIEKEKILGLDKFTEELVPKKIKELITLALNPDSAQAVTASALAKFIKQHLIIADLNPG